MDHKTSQHRALTELIEEIVTVGNDRGVITATELDEFVSKILVLTGGPRFTQEEWEQDHRFRKSVESNETRVAKKVVLMAAAIEGASKDDILMVLREMKETLG